MGKARTRSMDTACPLLLLLLLATPFLSGATVRSTPPRRSVAEHHERFLHRAAERRLASAADASNTGGRVFYLTTFGADPSGNADSSAAIMAAVNQAFNAQTGWNLLPGVNDLGGIVLDLQGGNYKISQPIVFPSGSGNVVVQGGTLRASDDFPADGYLIELSADGPETMRYEDITFRDILFDANYLGGGLSIVQAARIRIDNCFFIHFATAGITINQGHETFISSCFLGQHLTVGGDSGERNFTGTAIELYGNDNAITDVAIFSAAIGVLVNGQANILTGIHCYNKATGFGGVGILVKLGMGLTRIDNCYLDFTGIVIEDPVQVHVTNGFFLGNAYVLLRSVKGLVSGLTIVNNMFTGDVGGTMPIVSLDETAGPFTTVEQVVVDANIAQGMKVRSTVARTTVAGTGNSWAADFSDMLLFPNRINHVKYSFYVPESETKPHRFPSLTTVRSVEGNVVVVESKKSVAAVVTVEVDQHAMAGEQLPWSSVT